MIPSDSLPEYEISETRIQTICLMILASVAGIYLVFWLRPVLVPLVVAFFIVSGVAPILDFLEKRFGVSRLVAAGIAFLLGLAVMTLFGVTVWVSMVDLSTNSSDYRQRVRQLVMKAESGLPFDLFSSDVSLLKPPPPPPANDRLPSPGDPPPPASDPPPGSAVSSETKNSPVQRSTSSPASETSPDRKEAASSDSDPATSDQRLADPDNPNAVDANPDESVASDTNDSVADESTTDRGEQIASRKLVTVPSVAEPSVPSSHVPSWREALAAETSAALPPIDYDDERTKQATRIVDAFVRDGIAMISQALISLVSTSVVVLIYVFFILLGSPTFKKNRTMEEVDQQVRGYLSLKTLISIGTGFLFGLTLHLFGVPMALSFGVLAFLLNFIPNIGPIVASVLPVPLIILDPSGNVWWMVAVIVATGTIQLISGNVVEPKVMGDSSDLHPVTILLALMFWGMMWGIVGMFLATPMTAAMKILLERFEMTRPVARLMAGRSSDDDDGDPFGPSATTAPATTG
ncbi:AI-2E family transporter [Crateriforma conspicua]|uniref:AI-2 transport protein TqsA n=1 Tax=Crateriforma conspicua TaxID=2527996 RepID=A0A5C5Y2Q5_9PLAN|nr:AI-2E family transporter [Crateriforma conspicua]TWT69470.1 AI-2 transport protein TqsA [Crateriforma conspicua]